MARSPWAPPEHGQPRQAPALRAAWSAPHAAPAPSEDLHAAQAQAHQLLEAARAQARQIEEQARTRGYEEGVALAHQQLNAHIEAAATSAAAIVERANLLSQARAQELTTLTTHVWRAVFTVCPQGVERSMNALVHAACDAIAPRGELELVCHPDDAGALSEAIRAHPGCDALRVREDATRAPGEFTVECGRAGIDVSVEARLQSALQAIAALAQTPASGDASSDSSAQEAQ